MTESLAACNRTVQARYETDADVWQAVIDDPDKIVMGEAFLREGYGQQPDLKVGEKIKVANFFGQELIEKEINSIIKEHLKYSRSDVALWGICIAMKYDFQIENFEDYSNTLITDKDCLPVLLNYEYAKKK